MTIYNKKIEHYQQPTWEITFFTSCKDIITTSNAGWEEEDEYEEEHWEIYDKESPGELVY